VYNKYRRRRIISLTAELGLYSSIPSNETVSTVMMKKGKKNKKIGWPLSVDRHHLGILLDPPGGRRQLENMFHHFAHQLIPQERRRTAPAQAEGNWMAYML
jgi:hypothetical protein